MNAIYADGGCLGNNQKDAGLRHSYGTFNYGDYTGSFDFGPGTNNEAEFKILIEALKFAKEGNFAPMIYMDSDLVVRAMHGTYNVKAKNLRPLYMDAVLLFHEIGAKIEWLDNVRIKAILGH
jgi:ribonuclease HI